METQTNTTKQNLIQQLGFDPYQLSGSVKSCGEIANGPYAGCVCVFTEHTGVVTELYRQPNFIDTRRGIDSNQSGMKTGRIYFFRSRTKPQSKRSRAMAG